MSISFNKLQTTSSNMWGNRNHNNPWLLKKQTKSSKFDGQIEGRDAKKNTSKIVERQQLN